MNQSKRTWLDRIFRRRRSRTRNRDERRKLLSEFLEQRQLLAGDDYGDTIGAAYSLNPTRNVDTLVSGTVGDNQDDADVDMFYLPVYADEQITIDIDASIDGSSLDSYVRVFDQYGYEATYNDNDANGGPDSFVTYTATEDGSLFIGVSSAGNTYYYPEYEGSGSYGYTTGDYTLRLLVDDGNGGGGGSGGGSSNTPPTSVNDSYTLGITNSQLVVTAADGVLANDNDVDGDALTAILADSMFGPTYGTVVQFNSDGSFIYQYNSESPGADSFSYYANDGTDDGVMVTVSIDVHEPPYSVEDDHYSVDEDSLLSVSAPGVLQNDYDPENAPITAVLQTQASNGTVLLNPDGSFTYQPLPDFFGNDSFSYTANDGDQDSDPLTVFLTVNPVDDPNVGPIGAADDYEFNVSTRRIVSRFEGVLANDSDPDQDELAAIIETLPSHGTLGYLRPDGSFEYTPNPGFLGTDSFSYRVDDGSAVSDPVTVSLSVLDQGFRDGLIIEKSQAKNDHYFIDRNTSISIATPGYLENDSDVDGQIASTTILSRPRFGTLTLGSERGSFDYVPYPGFVGIDSFRYQVTNEVGTSHPVTVELEVVEPATVLDLDLKPNVIAVGGLGDGTSAPYTTLRMAVEQANASSGKDIIQLPTLTGDLLLVDDYGPITVDSEIEIVASDESRVIRPYNNHVMQLFHITENGKATLRNLTLSGGIADGSSANRMHGGAVLNEGDLTLYNVHVADNEASFGDGGGIYNAAGASLKLFGSTVSGNSAYSDGGGIFNSNGATLALNSSTVSGNSAMWGGGIYSAGLGSVVASTIVLNQAGTGSNLAAVESLDISNSIFALGDSPDIDGPVNSLGGNLIGGDTMQYPYHASDLVGDFAENEIDPLLGPLQDNGGMTPTHLPLPGSPVIDAGTAIHRFEDQRGADRVVDGLDAGDLADTGERIDIGATEFGTFFPSVLYDAVDTTPLGDGRVDVDPATPGDQVSIRGAIQELNALAGYGNTAGLGSGQLEGGIHFDDYEVSYYMLELAGGGEEIAAYGDLDVYGKLSIHGDLSGPGTPLSRIDGGWEEDQNAGGTYEPTDMEDRIFHVHPGAKLDASAITITGGRMDFDYGYGGGILNEQGTVLLGDVSVVENVAQHGGGIANLGGMTVISAESDFVGNYAALGGGVYLDGGTVTVDDSLFHENAIEIGGASFYVEDGELLLTNGSVLRMGSVLYGFDDPQGMAIFAAGGVVNVTDGAIMETNGYHIGDNYASGNFNAEYLMPDPAHRTEDTAQYLPSAVVFVTEDARFNFIESTIQNQHQYVNVPAGEVQLTQNTIPIINLGHTYSRDSTFYNNDLTIANFHTGEAIIEGGLIRDVGGHYDFFGASGYPGWTDFNYASSNISDNPVQNHNGRMTLLGVTFDQLNRINYLSEVIANYGIQARMDIIGVDIDGGSIRNEDGELNLRDSHLHDGYYLWYDDQPDSLIQNSSRGNRITAGTKVPELVLSLPLEDNEREVHVADSTPILQFDLPYDVVVNEERMIVTDVDVENHVLTVSRPHPQDHAVDSNIILRNEYVNQIKVDDLEGFKSYDLPLDVYLTTSTGNGTFWSTGEARFVGEEHEMAAHVEAMTITSIDYERGLLSVLRGRYGTTPARFSQPDDPNSADMSTYIYGMPGQMTISGTTFANNAVDIGPYWLQADSSVSLVRSSSSELAPPLIVENSTFSGTTTNGPVANLFAERVGLHRLETFHSINYEMILIDGADQSFVVEPNAELLPAVIAENNVFAGSFSSIDGTPVADTTILAPSQQNHNFIELRNRNTEQVRYVDLSPPDETTEDSNEDPPPEPAPPIPLEADANNRPKRITLDGGSQTEFIAPATPLSDGYLGDGWLLRFDERLAEQEHAEYGYYGLETGTYSISTVFRKETEGTIAFRVNNVERYLDVTTQLRTAVDSFATQFDVNKITIFAGEHLRIGEEELLVESVSDNGDDTLTLNVVRGTQGTTAVAHDPADLSADSRVIRSDFLYIDEFSNLEFVTFLEDYDFNDQSTDYEVDGKIDVHFWAGTPGSVVVADAVQIREKLIPAPGQADTRVLISSDSIGSVPEGAHVDFGTTLVGSPRSMQFEVYNDSTETLTIPGIVAPSGFSVSGDLATTRVLDPGVTETFTLTLAANAVEQAHGPIIIHWSPFDSSEFFVSGVAVINNALLQLDSSDTNHFSGNFSSSNSAGFNGNYRYAFSHQSDREGLWEVEVDEGLYRVATTWPVVSNNADDTPFTLYDEVDVLDPYWASAPAPSRSFPIVSLIDASAHDPADLFIVSPETTAIGNRLPFGNSENVALNAIVTSYDSDDSMPHLHDLSYLTDGIYGNGSSFRSMYESATVTLDLGTSTSIDSVSLGRDRTAAFDDFQIGELSIAVSTDGYNYSTVYDSWSHYTPEISYGYLPSGHTLEAIFSPVNARYVQIYASNYDYYEPVVFDEIEVWAADTQPPEVSSVILGSTVWSPTMIDAIDGASDNGLGYDIFDSSEDIAPWQGIDRVYIQFTEDVVAVTAADVALIGASVDHTDTMNVLYDDQTHTATLELSAPLAADRLRLAINETLADQVGNVIQDIFDFRFDTLPGDVDRDGIVTSDDGDSIEDQTALSYDAQFDLDGDGVLTAADLFIADNNAGTALQDLGLPRGIDPDPPTPDENDIVLESVRLDQRVAPSSLHDDGHLWHHFGQYPVLTDVHENGQLMPARLLVTTSNDVAGHRAIADSIRVQRVAEVSVSQAGEAIEHDGYVGFGLTRVGSAIEKTFTLTNDSMESYALREVQVPGGFSVTSNFTAGQLLAPGESADITIRLDAARAIKSYGEVLLVFDDLADGDTTQADHLHRFLISGSVLDEIGVQDVQIVDNSDPGVEFFGHFDAIGEGYREHAQRARNTSFERRAFWTLDVQPGTYELAATWPALTNNDSSVPIAIYDGFDGPLLGTPTANQRALPEDYIEDHVAWSTLGEFTATGNTLVVEMVSNGNNRFVADALRVQRTAELTIIDEYNQIMDNRSHLGLGVTELGAGVEQSFTVTNNSSKPYALRPIVPPEGFTIHDNFTWGQILPSGTTTDFVLTLNTDRVNKAFGKIAIIADDGEVVDALYEFSVSGTVVSDVTEDQIVDNLDDGVDWVGFKDAADFYGQLPPYDIGYDDSTLFANGFSDVSELSQAIWIADVEPGTYHIATTWVQDNHAHDAPFYVVDGANGQILQPTTVDQEELLHDVEDSDTEWQSIGAYNIESNTVKIVLFNDTASSGRVVADAIKLSRVSDSPPYARAEKVSSQFFGIHACESVAHPVSTTINRENIDGVDSEFVRFDFEDVPSGTYRLLTSVHGLDDGRVYIDPDTDEEWRIDDPIGRFAFYDEVVGHNWYDLTDLTVFSDDLSIEIHRPAYEQNQSPAVCLMTAEDLYHVEVALPRLAAQSIETNQSRRIIDNNDIAYSTSASVNSSLGPHSYNGSHDLVPAGETATWQVGDLVPGIYLVASSLDPSLNTSLPFTISEPDSILSSGSLDYTISHDPSLQQLISRNYTQRQFGQIQEFAYGQEFNTTILGDGTSDFRATTFFDEGYSQDRVTGEETGRHDWVVLDRVEITGTEMTIELTGGQNVRADAIRLERFRGTDPELSAFPVDLDGLADASLQSQDSPIIDHGIDSLFKGIDIEVERHISSEYTDGWLYVDDVTRFIRGEDNLEVPVFPFPIQVGRETMLAMGYDLDHGALIVERGHASTTPIEHFPGDKILYGFSHNRTTLAQHIEDPSATLIRVDEVVGLPTTKQFDIRLGSEEMTVTEFLDNGDGTFTFKVNRGVHGTTPEAYLPIDTRVLLLHDQSGGNRFYDGDANGTRRLDQGAFEAVYIDVNSTADLIDTNPGDGFVRTNIPDTVTLRAAINEANAIGGYTRISLNEGTYDLAASDETEPNDELHGDFDIYGHVEIRGTGANATILNANELGRLFEVHPGGRLVLRDVKLTGGVADQGGAILVEGGSVELFDSSVEGNTGEQGAALLVRGDGSAALTRSSVVNNSANGAGGGIRVVQGHLDLDTVTVSSNTAESGAGISLAEDATAAIESSTIVYNDANRVGGIESVGTTTITKTVVANNSSAESQRKSDVYGRFESAGFNFVGMNPVRQTQVYSHDRNIYANTYSITITDPSDLPQVPFKVLVHGEQMSVRKVSGNVLHIDTQNVLTTSLPIVADGDNLDFDGFWMNSDRRGSVEFPLDPRIGPLAQNGGTTPTHLPDIDSPLIDAGMRYEGTPEAKQAIDQRGDVRYFDANLDGFRYRDIGAVEWSEDWVAFDSVTVAHVETETTNQTFEFPIRRSQADESLTVAYSVVGVGDHPVNGADFVGGVLPSGTVIFDAGEFEKTVSIEVAGDDRVEADQYFEVRIVSTSPTTNSHRQDYARGLILNDDTVRVTVLPASNVEGTPSAPAEPPLDEDGNIAGGDRPYEDLDETPTGTQMTFTIELDRDVEGGLSVEYFTQQFEEADGFASKNDFWEKFGTLTFAGFKGEQQFVSVTLSEDATVELDEAFGLGLGVVTSPSDEQDQAIKTVDGVGMIINDDSFTIGVGSTTTYTAPGFVMTIGTVSLSANVDRPVQGTVTDGTPFYFSGGKGESFLFFAMSDGPFSVDSSSVSAYGREASYVHGQSSGGEGEQIVAGSLAEAFENVESYFGLSSVMAAEGEPYVPYDVDGDGIADPPVVTVWGSEFQWDWTKPHVGPLEPQYDHDWCDPKNIYQIDTVQFAQDLVRIATYETIISALLAVMDHLPVATEHDEHLEITSPFFALASVVDDLWGEILLLDYNMRYAGCHVYVGPPPPDSGGEGDGGGEGPGGTPGAPGDPGDRDTGDPLPESPEIFATGAGPVMDITIDEDTSTPWLSFEISDDVTPVEDLIVTATSSNTTLLPESKDHIKFDGEDNEDGMRQIQLTPVLNRPKSDPTESTLVTIEVEDGDNNVSKYSFTLTVRQKNDKPEIDDPGEFEIDENYVGNLGTLTATDIEGDTLFDWQIDGGTHANLFAIDASSGLLSVPADAVVDYDIIGDSLTLDVSVSDGKDRSDSFPVIVNINDLDDLPPTVSVSGPLQVHEDEDVGFVLTSTPVSEVTASDPDPSGMISDWEIVSGNDDGIFGIEPDHLDPTNGIVSVIDRSKLDFEATETYTLGVIARDSEDNESSPVSVTIDVLNVIEGPEIEIEDQNGNGVSHETGLIDFGEVEEGAVSEVTLTIHNRGDSNLDVDSLNVLVPSGFSITPLTPGDSIPADGSSTFTLTLDTTTRGIRFGDVTIPSNDSLTDGIDESLFKFSVNAEVVEPDLGKAPTTANTTIYVKMNADYQFESDDVLFADEDSDPLDHIELKSSACRNARTYGYADHVGGPCQYRNHAGSSRQR